jgi:hypothetical protein
MLDFFCLPPRIHDRALALADHIIKPLSLYWITGPKHQRRKERRLREK